MSAALQPSGNGTSVPAAAEVASSGAEWAQIYAVFAASLRLPPLERDSFLNGACAGNARLRTQVDELLAQDAQASRDRFLDIPEPSSLRCASFARQPETALVGRRIGPYELRQWIASGGMGAVYRAARVEGYQQEVALKLIHNAFWSEEVLRRFSTERQVLANLNHPHIARLLDGAATEEKWPYLVMEYIDGQPINRFCDQHQKSVAERVRLLQAVCAAVQYAHERGVVHRDIKPANILVCANGTPKLTDFGLAKQLGEDSSQTQTGQILGTPSYMAPEQATGRTADVGPATDVYALGAILYELLTGRPPFKAATMPETLELVARQDPLPPRRLQPGLPGDLETICMKCLEKEPARRYASAAALDEDLRRFQAGEPIRARPIGRAARVVRWCRRKPLVAGLMAALALVAAGSFAAVLALWLVAEGRGKQTLQEKERAARQRDRALELLDEMTRVADKSLSVEPGQQKLQGEVLEKILKNYEELALEPEIAVDSEFRNKTAEAYYRVAYLGQRLGADNARILQCCRRAIAIWERLTEEMSDDSRFPLALFHCHNHVGIHSFCAGAEQAEALQRAFSLAEYLVERFPDEPKFRDILASQYNALARRTADLEQAKKLIQRGIDISQELCREHPGRHFFECQLARGFEIKAAVLQQADDLHGAEEAMAAALKLSTKLSTLDIGELPTADNRLYLRLQVACDHQALGLIQHYLGRFSEAEMNLTRSLTMIEELANAHPHLFHFCFQRGQAYYHLAEFYDSTGRHKEAAQAYDHSIRLYKDLWKAFEAQRNSVSQHLIGALCVLPPGDLERHRSDLAEAVTMLGQPRSGSDWACLGYAQYRLGKTNESILALERWETPDATVQCFLAMACCQAGDRDRARAHLRQANECLGHQRDLRSLRLRAEAATMLGLSR